MIGPTDTQKGYVERRLYLAGRCTVCGHKYQSFRRKYINLGRCRKHRHEDISAGQVSIFPENPENAQVFT